MTITTSSRVDIARVRAEHPIEQAVAAAGVDLVPRGRGLMGCCPFHDDDTASMSVGAIPDRFHCFGCGASGDVIDFVGRLYGLSFRESVDRLDNAAPVAAYVPTDALRRHPATRNRPQTHVTTARAFEVNALAWQHFSTPVATEFADHYLRNRRGIDLTALRAQFPNAPLLGAAGHVWTGLVHHLRAHDVTDDEILAMDLGMRTRGGNIVDTLRDRLILPVTDPTGAITGFIGRDTSRDPRAPKYRNPTRTATFDKRTTLYRPTHHALRSDATLVVVEGPLDALAIAAAAARAGDTATFAPCTTNGVTVSDEQAAAVARLHTGPVVVALDGDQAGAEGTLRWIAALALTHQRAPTITRLPDRLDPADWIARHGERGLDAFRPTDHPAPADVTPHQAGRELVQLALSRVRDPVRDTTDLLLPLAATLPARAGAELLHQAEDEMTRSGWNPHGVFSRHLRERALATLRHPLAEPALAATEPPPFRRPDPHVPTWR